MLNSVPGKAVPNGLKNSGCDTAEVVELVEPINTNRERLCESLTEAQVERFSRYDDCIDELENITAREAFAVGFRLGMRFAAEAIELFFNK